MRFLIPLLAALLAQQPPPQATAEKEAKEAAEQVDFICPMDKDVRTKGPGKCPRCGMKLVAGIPDPHEYPVNLKLTPRVARPGKPVDMEFRIENPKDGSTVSKFEIMHEKLFHLFMVSEDLSFFAHEHPEYQPGGASLPTTIRREARHSSMSARCTLQERPRHANLWSPTCARKKERTSKFH